MIKNSINLGKQILYLGQLKRDILDQQNKRIKHYNLNADRITPISFNKLDKNIITDIAQFLKKSNMNISKN